MKTWHWIAIGSGVAVVLIGVLKRKEITSSVIETVQDIYTSVWDIYTEQRIKKLHPAIRETVRAFINALDKKHGIKVRIPDNGALRAFDEQAKIYNQPWDRKDNDGDGYIDEADEKVSNAQPGYSYHNYGLAFDLVEIKNGKALWDNPNWPLIGQVGKSFGFRWGGDFKNFKDLPHFEWPTASISTLLAQYNAGQTDAADYLLNIT